MTQKGARAKKGAELASRIRPKKEKIKIKKYLTVFKKYDIINTSKGKLKKKGRMHYDEKRNVQCNPRC